MTEAENKLWERLRNKQLGVKFRRQYSIGPYFVDFYCPEKRFVIEIDGKHHKNRKEYDEYRTNYLNTLNINLVRFWNDEIINSIDVVIEKIEISLLE